MKKLFAFICAAALAFMAFSQDFVTTATIGSFGHPFDIPREDVSKVDFSTNKVSARVWHELSTNSVVKRDHSNLTLAIYTDQPFPEVYRFTRTTTVFLTRIAEVEGVRVQIGQRIIQQTNESFTVQ